MLQTGLDDLSHQVLGDLGCFLDAPAFGDESGHIRAGGEESSLLEGLDMQTDRCFLHDYLYRWARSAYSSTLRVNDLLRLIFLQVLGRPLEQQGRELHRLEVHTLLLPNLGGELLE